MKVSVMILAAGAGTRMRSSLPKVLHKIAGREMLYYSIASAQQISDDVTVVLFHQAERVQRAMEQHFSGISFVIQDHANYPGTGGAMMGIDPKHERVLVLNGDMPLIEAEELKRFVVKPEKIVMSVLELKDGSGYGRVIIRDGSVERIVEEKDATEEERKIGTVNAGVYLFDRALLAHYLPRLSNENANREYYLTDVVEMAQKDGVAIAPLFVKEENFKGVNSKLDLALAEQIMVRRLRDFWMRKGVVMRLPETIYLEAGVVFKGESTLENGVVLTGDCLIEDSHIRAHSVVESSHLIRSDVGPLAHIRPGCEIVETHIGNFVEVKKSKLNGVKAGHLSYLGDCEIGEGSNVGAGVITCNYDGKKKHQTTIGKYVFIGSDTQLIAPVVIEDETVIAAGSTITREVKRGELAISRVKQSNIAGFFVKFFGESKS